MLASLLLAAGVMAASGARQPGTIVGTVTVTSGGVVPGVTIEVTIGKGPVLRQVVTGVNGEYRVEVEPGEYAVTARLSGFKTQRHANTRVEVGAVVRVDMTIEVDLCGGEVDYVYPQSMREAVSMFPGIAHIRIEKQLPWVHGDGDAARFETRVLQWAKPPEATDTRMVLTQECVYAVDDDGDRMGLRRGTRAYAAGEEYITFLWKKRPTGPYLPSGGPFTIPVVRGGISPDIMLQRAGMKAGMRATDLMRELREAAAAAGTPR